MHLGDLLQGDRHGLLTIPRTVAAEVRVAAHKLRVSEEAIIALCESGGFSLEGLRDVIRGGDQSRPDDI